MPYHLHGESVAYQIFIPGLFLLAGIMLYAAVHHFAFAIIPPRNPMQLVFSAMCLLAASIAISHAHVLEAGGIPQFVEALKWNIGFMLLFVVLFLWFVALYTGQYLKRFMIGLSAWFAVLIVVNQTLPNSIQYERVEKFYSHLLPWGERLARVEGNHGYWVYAAVASIMVVFGYALHAMSRKYLKSRQFADMCMLCAISLLLGGASLGILVRLDIIHFVEPGPITILAMVIVMSVALTSETQHRLRMSERRFRSLVEQSPFSIQVMVPDGYTRLVNHAWEKLWGVKLEQIAGYNILQDKQLIEKGVMRHIEKGFSGEAAVVPPVVYNPADNPVVAGPVRSRWVASNIYPIKDESGTIVDVILVHQDITEHKLVEDSLRESEMRFRSVIEQAPVGMSFSRDGYTLDVNPAFLKMFGYDDVSEVRGQPVINRIAPHCRVEMQERIIRRSMGEPTETTYETIGLRKDGSQFPLFISAQRVMLNDGPISSAFLFDFTERKSAEKKINQLAFYDPLTGLPNRQLLIDRLQHALVSAARRGRWTALLLIDLDNFKTLNDSLGHATGDLLLQQVPERLAQCVREDDTVARFGGDEFVVILEDLGESTMEAAAQTEAIGEKILAALSQPCQLGTHEYRCTASIGATLFSDNQQTIDELLKQADIAMYQAKRNGRNLLRFFDPQMQDTINERAVLEGKLHKAIENNQLRLYYQVQVDSTGHAVGAEALIRWENPEAGMVSPDKFIPLAEDTGLILPIGERVLDAACAQLKKWEHSDLTRRLILSVNISAKQFLQTDFATQVVAAMRRYRITPELLKLELTEGMLLENIEDIIVKMEQLRKDGVRFSLDDFGTGYSSLQYLKRLPLDQLKIDQSFVRDIAIDSSDRTIVSTIIVMAQTLGLEVIAEGVETEAQRQLLLDMKCMHYQGHLFGKPVPAEQFEA